MELSPKQRRHLKSLAHPLKVVVQTGAAGLTRAVLDEIDRALRAHELLKVRLVAGERREREAMIRQVCEATGAAFVQRVGHIATFYRPHPDKPVIELPRN